MKDLFSQGGGSTGIKTNKQAIARHYCVKPSEVTYFSVGGTLNGYKVLYDKVSQRSYSLPVGIPSGITMVSLVNGLLTHTTGTVDLAALAVVKEEWFKRQENFTTGFTLNEANEVVNNGIGLYRWAGSFPKTVSAASTVIGTGGESLTSWVRVDVFGTREYTDRQIARSIIYLEDIVSSTDGTLDVSGQINAKLQSISGKGITLKGTKGQTYRIDATIDFTGLSDIILDFGHATVLDNVQGFIPQNGNRANHTFVIYNASDVVVKNIVYDLAATRADAGSAGPYTCVFWVGGQYLGAAMTSNIHLSGFRNVTGKGLFNQFPVSAVGELDGLRVSDFFIDGGQWGFGINLEYGLRPVDLATDFTMNNGRHPYNVRVEHFCGQNLLDCQGFLRVASCYNVVFLNCTGYNVKNFIYGYSGDRGITRYSQNVKFVNCKSKINPSVLGVINYAVHIVVVNHDGSTGEELPSWTNYDHVFIFENCEFMHNQATNSAAIRVFGNKGSVIFKGCIIERAYYGIWAGPSSNPDYVMDTVIHVEDCVFKNNYRDVNMVNCIGSVFNKNQFKMQNSGSSLVPISLTSSPRTKFRDNFFGAPAGNRASITIDANSPDCALENNYFTLLAPAADYALDLNARTNGFGNKTNGTKENSLTLSGSTKYGIREEPHTMVLDLSLVTGTAMNADQANTYLSTTTKTVDSILNGLVGDEVLIRSTLAGSSVTFTNNASGVGSNRLVMLGNANVTKTGNDWAVRFKKLPGSGWYQVA